MSRSFLLTQDMVDYVVANSRTPDDVLVDLAAETATLGGISGMQISHEQGVFLELVARMIGARSAIEIGTFTGYSSICIARGMGPDGCLLCCDASETWTSMAQRYWERAGLQDQINLRIGPGAETVASLPADTVFDLAFVDADKTGYLGYVDQLHPLMRTGGLIMLDNTLWSGRVLPEGANAGAQRPEVHADDDPDTVALRQLNPQLAADDRFDTLILPFADGVTMLLKR